jgi:hypothetical protein
VFDTYAGELGPGLFNRYEYPLLKAIAMEVRQQVAERKLDPVPMVRSLSDFRALAMVRL